MIRRLSKRFQGLAQAGMPDPFLFAILLTLLTFLLGILIRGCTLWEMVQYWERGFWEKGLMTFAFQMCLILVFGHALAAAPTVKRLIRKLSAIPPSTGAAVVLTALLAMSAGLINWGLGLITGALMAREIRRRFEEKGKKLHYPLVVAAGYTGLLVWHGGLSGSAPVLVASENHFLQAEMGIIPVSATLFSTLNLVCTGLMLLAVPFILLLMVPKKSEEEEDAVERKARKEMGPATPAPAERPGSFVEWLERSPLLSLLIAIPGFLFILPHFATKGAAGINLNSINFTFLFLGILLHGSPIAYVRAVGDGVRGVGGIVLQFPFYFGIMGMMKHSGLVLAISEGFVHLTLKGQDMGIPPEICFPFFVFLSAALINLFIPSGGGQWAVQGVIIVKAAQSLNLPLPNIVMAFAYGDQVTNMLQPFWAIALLGITGLRARDIIGYTALLMILVLPIFIGCLILF